MARDLDSRGWTPVFLDLHSPTGETSAESISEPFPVFSLQFLDETALQDCLKQIESVHGDIRGCLHFQTPFDESVSIEERAKEELFQAFLLAKHLKNRLAVPSPGRRPFFMALARFDGSLGYDKGMKDPIDHGLSGMLKSLQKEWPGILCRLVDLDPGISESDAKFRVLAEIFDADLMLNEVAYLGDQRRTVKLVPAPETVCSTKTLEKNPVFLVSGGARGVTAECVVNLAQTVFARFILLGRTPLEEEPDWAVGLEIQALKQRAIEFLKESGEKPTPQKVRKAVSMIEANRSISSTLMRIRNAGAEVEYIATDVADAEALRKVLKPLIKKWGPVTGIIHGAGVLADQWIENKNLKEIQQVFHTKVHGLNALLEVTDPASLRHLILFSSAAGFFGNAGQTDYAAANEILNQAAIEYQNNHPDCRVISFNWGPWEGGMVTVELKKLFEERGVFVIPVEQGVRIFTESLLNSEQDHPLLVVGSTMGVPEASRLKTESTFRIQRTLNLDQIGVLKDHRIGDNAVLPAAFALAWIADCALRLLPGYQLALAKNFKVFKGIVFDSSLADFYTVKLELNEEEPGKDLLIEAKIYSGKDEKPRFHYGCGLALRKTEASPPLLDNLMIPGELHSQGIRYYEDGTLFHGPAFQGVREVLTLDETGLMLSCSTSTPDAENWGSFSRSAISPMALDMAFQAMLIWTRVHHHSASLPLATETIELFADVPAEQEFLASFRVLEHTESLVKGDVILHDRNSRIFARMLGAEVTVSEKLNRLFAASS